MLRQAIYYLAIGLLATAAGQCKCREEPIYDTTQFELTWEKEAQALAASDLALPATGLICHVPASSKDEAAVYFLDTRGKAWKFTRGAGLVSEAISDPKSFSLEYAFAFAAGPAEKQDLYFGNVSFGLSHTSHLDCGINLKKYTAGGWQPVPCSTSWSIDNPIELFVACCAFREVDQLCGCLMVSSVDTATSRPQTTIFVFDPETQNFNSLPSLPPLFNTSKSPLATALELEEPGKIILAQNGSDTFPMLSVARDTVAQVPIKVSNSFSSSDWEGCSLSAGGEFPILVPILTTNKGGIRTFYKLDKQNHLVSTGDLPQADLSGGSLVLPFADEVYLVTKVKDDTGERIVYYRGRLQYAAKQPPAKKQ